MFDKYANISWNVHNTGIHVTVLLFSGYLNAWLS